ncbi:DUF2306 domain-containing protein [Tunicatimonas pelagia]|uniref:DUF2306 domain-containing protein n=1 Tax=Tunicatimonas pelagia TaxID=931531 RepID=UPI0026663FF8|nr:DUF2306 domain-containing protein [Tunicatimonas pelagia]WKN41015.1 DUF2306 domain-containing protein [Tunicatimonas pelagia]
MPRNLKTTAWRLICISSLTVSLYPLYYLLANQPVGLLMHKSGELLVSTTWNIAFYSHICLGGVALAVGWMQFVKSLRQLHPSAHGTVGIVYAVAVLISGLSGIYIAQSANGGLISGLGFATLGIAWLATTGAGCYYIIRGKVVQHRAMMTYSYALCLAAVTLRILLPLLIILFGEFVTAYRVVAWLCWLPNLGIAYLIQDRSHPKESYPIIIYQTKNSI